jgi:hypothetical protein
MRNAKTFRALAIAALVGCIPAQAADKACTRADTGNAQRAIDKVVSWPQLRKAWQDYKHCDKGDVADQYTDALLRLVVDWKNIEELAAAMDKDPDYKAFVLEHLKSPSAKDDQPTVYSRAKKSCPANLDAFCAQVAEAVKGGDSAAPSATMIQPLMQPFRIEEAPKGDAPKADAKK